MFSPKIKAYVIQDRLKGEIPSPEEVNYYSSTENEAQCSKCIFFSPHTSKCSVLEMEVLPEAICDVFIETNKHDAISLVKDTLSHMINRDNGFPILTAMYGHDEFGWEHVDEGIYPFEYAFSDDSCYHIPICRLGEEEKERFSLTIESFIGTNISLPELYINEDTSKQLETVYCKGEVLYALIPKDWNINLDAKYSLLKEGKVFLSPTPDLQNNSSSQRGGSLRNNSSSQGADSNYPTIAWKLNKPNS